MSDEPEVTQRSDPAEHFVALKPGTMLGKYRIDGVLGQGGFGITYRAVDTALDRAVAIKEYLPSDVAVRVDGTTVKPRSRKDDEDFNWGLSRFLDEAKALAKFGDVPGVVRVFDFMAMHGTAYMVMELVEGQTLGELLRREGKLDENRLKAILLTLMQGLGLVHGLGFLHRDIKPGNILLKRDGTPVLIDFGAARSALGERSRSMTQIFTPGFAPFEQYMSGGKQGPWTDIYALGATMYQCITGKVPPAATDRMREDPMVPAAAAGQGRYGEDFLRAIDAALEVHEDRRPQSMEQWRAMLDGGSMPATTVSRAQAAPATRLSRPVAAAAKPRRGLAMALGVVAVALIGGGAIYAFVGGGDRAAVQDRQRADADQAERAKADQTRADQARADQIKADAERQAAEEAKRKEEVEARLKAQEDALKRIADAQQAAEEARRQAEAARQAAEETRRKAEEDAAKRAAEDAKRRADEEARKKAEDEAKKKADAEAAKKKADEAAKTQQAAAPPPAAAPALPSGRRVVGGEELRKLFSAYSVERMINGRVHVLTYFPDGRSLNQVEGREVERGTWNTHSEGYCVTWPSNPGGRQGCLKVEVDGSRLITSGNAAASNGTLVPRRLAAMPAEPQASASAPFDGSWTLRIDCPGVTNWFRVTRSNFIRGHVLDWAWTANRNAGQGRLTLQGRLDANGRGRLALDITGNAGETWKMDVAVAGAGDTIKGTGQVQPTGSNQANPRSCELILTRISA